MNSRYQTALVPVRASSRNTIAHMAQLYLAHSPRQSACTVRARPARKNGVQVPTHNGELVGCTSFLTYAATWRQRSITRPQVPAENMAGMKPTP